VLADDVPISPLPVKTLTTIGTLPTGEKRIVLRCSTPQGADHYWFSDEHALALASELAEKAGKKTLFVAGGMPGA